MPYFLAIDAGGTKAEYVLADETRIVARIQGGTIKLMRTTAEVATANLDDALTRLVQASGCSLSDVISTCVGTAGNTVPLVTDWLRQQLSQRVGGRLTLLGDVEIALDAAFPGESGILVLAGTGSNVAARSRNGQVLGAGGYGPVLADQGSGHRIGQQALRAVFLAKDEQRSTTLQQEILSFWKLSNMDELVSFANTCPTTEFSRLARLVTTGAEAGDAVAMHVLQAEGRDLAYLALLLHRQLHELDGENWQPKVAFAGSVLQHIQPLRETLITTLQMEIAGLQVLSGVVDPVMGALWRARQTVADF